MTQNEFYESIPGWISKPKESWNHITLMAFFCHKYEEKNGVKFRLVKWRGSPGLGKESRDFAKLFKLLAPEDYSNFSKNKKDEIKHSLMIKISNYVSWMFDYKFRSGEKSVTGTGLFLLPSMINEFERMYSSMLKRHKEEASIDALASWCREAYPAALRSHQIGSVEELAILEKYIGTYSLAADEPEVAIINKAKQLGIIK